MPSDTRLIGEAVAAFLFFTCYGLEVNSVSEIIGLKVAKSYGNPLGWITAKRSSYIVLKVVFGFKLEISFLGTTLGIIAFLLCLASEDSFLRMSLFVSH